MVKPAGTQFHAFSLSCPFQGQLKLIDFGIAKSIQGDTTSIARESQVKPQCGPLGVAMLVWEDLPYRLSGAHASSKHACCTRQDVPVLHLQVGTLNYMSPEAIQGGSSNPLGGEPMKVGRASDVWSLGCILYQVWYAQASAWRLSLGPHDMNAVPSLLCYLCDMQMIYGRTPFADLPFIPKMNAICNSSYQINFPPCSNPAAVDVIRRCLDRNPRTRITIQVHCLYGWARSSGIICLPACRSCPAQNASDITG
jgi:serine/threonine-protein kinase TTK/MPS1